MKPFIATHHHPRRALLSKPRPARPAAKSSSLANRRRRLSRTSPSRPLPASSGFAAPGCGKAAGFGRRAIGTGHRVAAPSGLNPAMCFAADDMYGSAATGAKQLLLFINRFPSVWRKPVFYFSRSQLLFRFLLVFRLLVVGLFFFDLRRGNLRLRFVLPAA